jgi:hypothetical protein
MYFLIPTSNKINNVDTKSMKEINIKNLLLSKRLTISKKIKQHSEANDIRPKKSSL